MLRHVTTPDDVRIACEVTGDGPPIVMVHGAGSARWSFGLVARHLERRFTVIAIDRRGRGDSTDAAEYALEGEFRDVAAICRELGPETMLFGHSYGGLVAAGAALELDLPRLALYEPAMGGVLTTAETIERWERLIAEGDRDTVVREFLRDVAGNDDAAIAELARTPVWAARREVVPTLPRELRAELAHPFEASVVGAIGAPTLVLVGSESPDWAVRSVDAYAEAIPNAEKRVLDGHGHGANLTAPELLAAELERFFGRD